VQLHPTRVAVAAALAALSCTDDANTTGRLAPDAVHRTVTATPGPVVISQVYGGGGNTGATLKNDFIELFNPGASPVSVDGWSVQYNSASGTGAWQTTTLTGSIPAGGYYLVQESAGAGGTWTS
jgi:trimeric autotransporter adhesin